MLVHFDPFRDSLLAGKSILFSYPLLVTSMDLLGVRLAEFSFLQSTFGSGDSVVVS